MTRRPTGKGIVVVAIGALIMLTGAAGHSGWLFVIAAAVEGLVFGSLFVPHRLDSVVVKRTVPERAVDGDIVEVTLSIDNHTKRALPLTRVEDAHDAFPTAVHVFAGIPPGHRKTNVTIRTARRGIYEAGTTSLSSGAPFGFLMSRHTCAVTSPIVVVPRSVEVPRLPFLAGGTAMSDASYHRARAGAGDEYLGVRAYRPGDSPRAIHWRSSARAGALIVREFEERAGRDLSLVIHGADNGEPPDSAFEVLLRAAASIARHALDSGHRLHLTATTASGVSHVMEPTSVATLEWLAAATSTDTQLLPVVGAALGQWRRDGDMVVLTTTSGRSAEEIGGALSAIAAAGRRPAAVVACAASWSANATEDEGLVESIKRMGHPVRVLARGEDLKSCLMA